MKVLCTLPNASTLINGIAFEETPDGMLSVSIDAETAAQFDGIRGYTLIAEEPKKDDDTKKPGKPPKE